MQSGCPISGVYMQVIRSIVGRVPSLPQAIEKPDTQLSVY